jgi:rfaE bifunctional protein kinase chain/domain/rfaE bifunctional protein nucleotidyltransferase chain/domain
MDPTHKILPLDDLLKRREAARAEGRTVVHCHGCFDIVHPGHIQHLQFARSLGDLLVVSVSADTHVNKGVDRPLIPDDLRAASVAALACVDHVHVNRRPTAVELLDALRPDVYVKGSEYERSADPRFLAERDTVMRHGGRVVFSNCGVVYSSTALIGSLGQPRRFEEDKLARFRERYGLDDAHLGGLLQRGRGQKVVVVGDYVLDRYHFCDATGVAGEGPMLSLRSLHARDFDGGAGVIALHLAALGAEAVLVGALADDAASRQVALRLAAGGVDVRCTTSRRQLVTKHRYLAEQTKLFKVDEGEAAPADSSEERRLAERVCEAADGAAAVVFADFGYGVVTAGLLDRVLPVLRSRVHVIAAKAGGRQGAGLLRFRGVDLLCPTERELREAQHDFSRGLGAAAWDLLAATDARRAIVTLGKQGLITFDRTDRSAAERLHSDYVPALSEAAVDALGCGDALLAAATLCLCAGGSLQAAALLGSIAAAIEVSEVGNVPIGVDRVRRHLQAHERAMTVAA